MVDLGLEDRVEKVGELGADAERRKGGGLGGVRETKCTEIERLTERTGDGLSVRSSAGTGTACSSRGQSTMKKRTA